MTVDVAESLCMSWLRHVKGCQVVETNWMVSSEWNVSDSDLNELNKKISNIKKKIKKNFEKPELKELKIDIEEIFKLYDKDDNKNNDNEKLKNFLYSAESDVIGFKFKNEKKNNYIGNYYGIDVAFHKDGLGYGNTPENLKRIVKKSIRTAMLFYAYLGNRGNEKNNVEIIFATPKLKPKTESKREEIRTIVTEIFKIFKEEFNYDFYFYAKEEFLIKILCPVVSRADAVHDTSEFFARSIQLQNVFFDYTLKTLMADASKEWLTNVLTREKQKNQHYLEGLENKDLVEKYVVPILESGIVDTDEIKKISEDKNYNSNTLGLSSFNFLIEEDIYKSAEENQKERYYPDIVVMISGKKYHICNQWKKGSKRKKLEDWIGNKLK